MNTSVWRILGLVGTVILAGCAGQTEQLSMHGPPGQSPESVTFPNGTTFGGASGRQASSLAQIMVDANNNNMRHYRGRQVLFVMIGSASATGNPELNERLSRGRSAAPEPIIDQYLVNVPHQYYKVYGLGDIYSPKNARLTVDQRYQNVRIIAVYQTDQVPLLPSGTRS